LKNFWDKYTINKHCIIFLCSVFSAFSIHADTSKCTSNKEAQSLIEMIIQDPLQQRKRLVCNPLLSQVAQKKAQAMADAGFVHHMVGGNPNSLLRNAGFELPKYYGTGIANQVEAIAGGQDDAQQVWREFKRSEGHRSHLLGEHPFYLEQDEIGVGYVYRWESPHVTYWVVYVTKRESSSMNQYDHALGVPDKGVITDTIAK